MELIYFGLIIGIILQLVLFIPAYLLKTDKLTDFAYGLTFIILGIFFTVISNYELLKLILLSMIILWGLRLSIYLVIRINKIGRDKRFDEIRDKPLKFISFWIIQGIIAWIILIPSIFFFTQNNLEINYLIFIGALVWLLGMIIESIADFQKYKFKNKHKNKWTNVGLWNYSRHPNYFGEMLIWIGIYIFTISNINNWLIGLISPLTIIILLRYLSGIPPLEKRYKKKFKGNKEYTKYVNKTNLLIPWFKKA